MVADHDQISPPLFGTLHELGVGRTLLDKYRYWDWRFSLQACDLRPQCGRHAGFECGKRFNVALVLFRKERSKLRLGQYVAHGKLSAFRSSQSQCLSERFVRRRS
jgi:hypothetical protein